MKKKNTGVFWCAALLTILSVQTVQAAVPVSDVSTAYDQAVDIQDELDSLDVEVRETTVVPGNKGDAKKTMKIQASGLQNLEKLQVAISITADDGEKDQYYKDGCFYTNETGKKVKYDMAPEEMLGIIDHYVYLNLNSARLAILDQDGSDFSFNATQESLGDYTEKVLEGVGAQQQVQLLAMQGTVETEENVIRRRNIQTVYTVRSDNEPLTCTVNTREIFHNPGQPVTVSLPDLSSYKEKEEKKAVVSVTPQERTIYATADVNVRAQNNVTATILGGLSAGDEIWQTGYTSDGWTQIQYKGAVAYVSSDYVSASKPVITTDMSGTMYATVSVNVRDAASASGAVLGILDGGDSVRVTGYTNNGWIRVNYNGKTAYVSSDYLTWDQPVTAMGGTMFVSSELANVRAYYSTDSAVLTTARKGEAVEVTGYTPNNWIAVNYQGLSGYIFGDLLTWDEPQRYTYGYIEGTVQSASMNTLSIWGDDGNMYSFSTMDATVNAPYGLSNGDSVAVYYTDQGGTLMATEVDDRTDYGHTDVGDDADGLTFGTVVSSGMSTITLACDDGLTRTFDKGDAYIDCPNGVYIGLYVSAAYYYDSQRGYVLNYLSSI